MTEKIEQVRGQVQVAMWRARILERVPPAGDVDLLLDQLEASVRADTRRELIRDCRAQAERMERAGFPGLADVYRAVTERLEAEGIDSA